MGKGFHIAGLGSSAGGLIALKDFFGNISFPSSTSFVVVSHLPKNSPTFLDLILAKVTGIKVHLLTKDSLALPNNIYVLPGNLRVTILGGVLMIRERTAEEIINTAIDEFLISLAKDQRHRAIAIILSGMGSDGALGAKTIHEYGGMVMVQSPESTPFDSMPNAAINADNPTEILSPVELGKSFSERVRLWEIRTAEHLGAKL